MLDIIYILGGVAIFARSGLEIEACEGLGFPREAAQA
jgi:hypothetical protein